MSFASSSRVTLGLVEETIPGQTPNSGHHAALRFTGESLEANRGKTQSEEIRDDRQISGMTTTSVDPRGGINIEWSYREYDALLRGLFGSNWVETTASITATFSANGLTAGGGTPFAGLVAGQWIKISGASQAENNGWFQILDKSSGAALSFADNSFKPEAATAGVSVQSSRLVNGVTPRFFSIERQHGDTGHCTVYRGCYPNKLSLQCDSQSKITGSFDFIGLSEASQSGSQLPGNRQPSQTHPLTNGVRSLRDLREAGQPLACQIKSFSLSLDNAAQTATACGTLGNVDIAPGTLAVLFSFEAYFNEGAARLKRKHDFDEETGFAFRLEDVNGNGYAFQLPNGQISKFSLTAGKINEFCMAKIEFTAYMDPRSGKTVLLDRCGI
ncbi:phage tail tube protein [Parachitinimonas caeni]|uniref:Phage tail tube protein n=1 Tax=Parachitinimonas caeni TaxID=3031301 RepID=A0ABT7DYD6_9NEIS|nr:phage tail tube protein [Parachitinimonas caeni]MDK2124150.1 phage tail tube protein [Parachitinimonas caeni]